MSYNNKIINLNFNRISMKNILTIALIFLFFFLNLSYISAEENITEKTQAELCLNNSNAILYEIIQNNFSYVRVNDSLIKAQSLYDAQVLFEQEGAKFNYSLILQYCNEINQIRESAFDSYDTFNSLEKFYASTITSEMNSSEIDKIIMEIEGELASERYEKVSPLIDKAYEKIAETKSSYTRLNLFYASTTRGLRNFFIKNWKTSLIVLIVFLLFFSIFNKRIRKQIILRKIEKLELRRATLQDLIKQTQKDYFQFGNMSEGNYNLRTKKFAEFIRDIDRQVPLLKEQLVRITKERIKELNEGKKNERTKTNG